MRDLDTLKKKILDVTKNNDSAGRMVRGSLAEDYNGIGKTVRVRVGSSAGATTVQATINQGVLIPSSLAEGSSVGVRITRGKAEVVSFGAATPNKVLCILKKVAATQPIPNGISTVTQVTFSTSQTVVDTHGAFDDVTTPDTIVIPFDGYYRVWAAAGWDSANYTRRIHIYVNGVSAWFDTKGPTTDGTGNMTNQAAGQNISIIDFFSADDTIQLWATQNSGAALVMNSTLLAIELVL
jgi:hypothetical protein